MKRNVASPGPLFLLLVPLFFFVAFFCGPVGDARSSGLTVEAIQKAYQNIKDIKGSFLQKSTIRDLKRTDTFKGTFMIKVPSKMRWQYQDAGKQDTEIFIDKGEIIVYQRNEKQVFRGKFDKEGYGQAPIALLGGFGSIGEEFDVTQKGGKLLLKPKRSMGSVVSIEIGPSGGEFPIGSLSIVDKRLNRIEIIFRNVVINSGLKDSAFVFSPPPGVSVYEYVRPR
ncbi:MAG: outer membrane lipoprotein carrier protein LolA [Nitrospirae bacterium]|nr:outer membrane lipoprotein carrier protein LolA [Nitrospirota bacterium]